MTRLALWGGLVAVGFIVGWMVAGWRFDATLARAEARIEALHKQRIAGEAGSINWKRRCNPMRCKSLLWWSVALLLAGCDDSIRSTTDPCKPPVTIPERWLNDQEIEILWNQDRSELKRCAAKVEALNGRKG